MQAGTARIGRRTLSLLTVVSLVASMVFIFAAEALADGRGSPPECQTSTQARGTGSLQTFTADDGEVVEGVCIKSGQLHTGVLGDGEHEDGCYLVSGVGTETVTVERIGTPGPDCQDISHVDVVVGNEPEPDPEIVIEPTLSCDMGWTGSAFTLHGVVDFILTPDEGVESISLTPVPGGDPSITGATWTGDPLSLQAWSYTWVANMEDGYVGTPASGQVDMGRDFFLQECTCPAGTLDLTDTDLLRADRPDHDSKVGEPASPVDIPAGNYEIYLASFDSHSLQVGTAPQPNEQWRLTDLIDDTGAFSSPATGDLPDDVNFQSYHVTASTGPVAVPEFANADIYATHTLLGGNNPTNSVLPTCAMVAPVTEPPGRIIVEKLVTDGSDTDQGFDFTASYDDDGFTLAHGDSDDSGDLPAGTYSVGEVLPDGWTLLEASCDDQSPIGAISLQAGETVTCTFLNDQEIPPEPETGEIVVEKVVLGDALPLEFTFNTTNFTLADNTLAHGESSSSGPIPAGDGYAVSEEVPTSWTLVNAECDNGSDPGNIDVAPGETVTCTFTNQIQQTVLALVLVDVSGSCNVVDDLGVGEITVSMSVPGGATVVIRDAEGDVVATFTEDGSVEVAENATYTWEATAFEGFEFPVDADTSGSVVIDACTEVLPFTGVDTDLMALIAASLGVLGGLVLLTTRRVEDS